MQHSGVQANRVNGVPTAEKFRDALRVVNFQKNQWEILKAHYNAPERVTTASDLAKAVGYARYNGINGNYGNLARKLSKKLCFQPPEIRQSGDPIFLSMLVEYPDGSKQDDRGHLKLQLREEVARAVELLGWN